MTEQVAIVESSRRKPLDNRRAGETIELLQNPRSPATSSRLMITLGFYDDGSVGEIFISGGKSGSEVEANVRDTAILASLAIQHGVPIATMASAITREGDGSASTIIGRVLDLLVSRETTA